MASYEVTGKVKHIYDKQEISEKFSKREFVVITDEASPYPQFITFQTINDKCSLLDNYQEGDSIKVSFNLRGREWNGPQGVKFFNTLEAWRIEKTESSSVTTPATPSQPVNTTPSPDTAAKAIMNDAEFTPSAFSDDLPF
jgi:hypothetical protein